MELIWNSRETRKRTEMEKYKRKRPKSKQEYLIEFLGMSSFLGQKLFAFPFSN